MCSNYNLKKLAVAVLLRAKTKAIRFGIAFVLHLRDRRTLLKAEDALVCLQANLATDFLCLFVSEPLNCVRQLQFIKACRRCSVARQNKSDTYLCRFCFAPKGPKNPAKGRGCASLPIRQTWRPTFRIFFVYKSLKRVQ